MYEFEPLMVMVPLAGVNFSALEITLLSTCVIRISSPSARMRRRLLRVAGGRLSSSAAMCTTISTCDCFACAWKDRTTAAHRLQKSTVARSSTMVPILILS